MVLVDIPKDVLQARTTFTWPAERQLPGHHVITQPHDKQLRAAADLIATAERPVLYVRGGVIKADASNELRELAEQTGIPVGDHPHGPRRVPDSHRLHYGMPCMHGTVAAVAALQRSDLLIALGARFDDRVTGDPASFAPHARVIHVDIDPAEIGKHRFADVPIVGDCKTTISSLIRHIRARPACPPAPDPTGWYADLDRLRDTFPLGNTRPPTGALAPERVIDAIGRTAGPDAIYVSGVGQHQMWAAHFITYDKPRTWLNSGGLGTMGYAVPAALGARLGTPDREVWAIDGDGCFQMTNQELATAAVEGIPSRSRSSTTATSAWSGNSSKSTTRAAIRASTSPPIRGASRTWPSSPKRSAALRTRGGSRGHHRARAIEDRPVVVDLIVDDTALVWPVIAAGASNDHLMLAQGNRPSFDESDHPVSSEDTHAS